ncbi:hypothetical protein AVEN_70229-1 [Araneus ventricosus]|uniref:Uncharacterized protein n=1 Tax=Araneus ventricosus TaxID=182803 RepID=A0A4Y2GD25_ARAVE|nr:hypothetical protein AVEN_70229-1 [Araneus ventricosus]
MDDTVDSFLNILKKEENENNVDFGFAKNLLRYVLLECYPTSNWQPNGIFAEDSMNSPLSLVVKSAVKMCLESNSEDMRDDFEFVFPYQDQISDVGHLDELLSLKIVLENKPFHNSSFLDYLCRFSEYTMLSYWSGIMLAPHITLAVICIMIREMREFGKITENLWKDFEDFCETYVQDEQRKRKLSKPKRRWNMFCAI